MLLAFTLLLGLAVPASAEFGTQDSANLKSISDDVFGISNAFRADNYTWDQNNNANMNVMSYIAYVLHSLKGTITNSGSSVIGFAPDNGSSGVLTVSSDSKDYFISRWKNLDANATITDANRWRVQTLSDNSGASWLYQVAQSVAQSGLTAEALMNWSNPSYASYKPSDTANYSWFNQVLQAVNNSKSDTSGLATEKTLSSFSSRFNSFSDDVQYFRYGSYSYYDDYGNLTYDTGYHWTSTTSPLSAISKSIAFFASLFVPTYNSSGSLISPEFYYSSLSGFNAGTGKFNSVGKYGSFIPAFFDFFSSQNLALKFINSNLLKLDEVLSTENDRALEAATDDAKVNVKDYVTDKKSNYGDSFTIGNTISDGLKPDLSTAQASSAVGGLFSPESSDYWGWFSSATDSDLHPAASGVSTLSLEDEPSPQDVADSETVWVINPYSSASDVVSDFFGGE